MTPPEPRAPADLERFLGIVKRQPRSRHRTLLLLEGLARLDGCGVGGGHLLQHLLQVGLYFGGTFLARSELQGWGPKRRSRSKQPKVGAVGGAATARLQQGEDMGLRPRRTHQHPTRPQAQRRTSE